MQDVKKYFTVEQNARKNIGRHIKSTVQEQNKTVAIRKDQILMNLRIRTKPHQIIIMDLATLRTQPNNSHKTHSTA